MNIKPPDKQQHHTSVVFFQHNPIVEIFNIYSSNTQTISENVGLSTAGANIFSVPFIQFDQQFAYFDLGVHIKYVSQKRIITNVEDCLLFGHVLPHQFDYEIQIIFIKYHDHIHNIDFDFLRTIVFLFEFEVFVFEVYDDPYFLLVGINK